MSYLANDQRRYMDNYASNNNSGGSSIFSRLFRRSPRNTAVGPPQEQLGRFNPKKYWSGVRIWSPFLSPFATIFRAWVNYAVVITIMVAFTFYRFSEGSAEAADDIKSGILRGCRAIESLVTGKNSDGSAANKTANAITLSRHLYPRANVPFSYEASKQFDQYQPQQQQQEQEEYQPVSLYSFINARSSQRVNLVSRSIKPSSSSMEDIDEFDFEDAQQQLPSDDTLLMGMVATMIQREKDDAAALTHVRQIALKVAHWSSATNASTDDVKHVLDTIVNLQPQLSLQKRSSSGKNNNSNDGSVQEVMAPHFGFAPRNARAAHARLINHFRKLSLGDNSTSTIHLRNALTSRSIATRIINGRATITPRDDASDNADAATGSQQNNTDWCARHIPLDFIDTIARAVTKATMFLAWVLIAVAGGIWLYYAVLDLWAYLVFKWTKQTYRMIVDMQMEQERRAFEKANGIKSPSLITVTQYKAGIRENLTAKERVYEDLYDLKYPMATSGWPRIKLAFCRALNFITRRQQDHPKAFGITEHTTQYKTRKRLRRRNIVRWWFEYVTYAPALLFLYIGVCGLVACYLQLRFCHSAMDNLDAILKPGEFNSTGTPDLVNVTASAPASGSAPKPRIMTREVPLTGVAALWEKIKPEISIPKTLYSHITATGSALIRDNAGSSHQDLLNSLGHLNTVRTEYKVARSLSTNSTNSAQQQQQQQQESEPGAVKYIVEWHAKVARDITARPASEPLSATEEATLSVPLAIIASLPGAVVDAGSIDTAQRAGRIERTIGRWFGVVPRSSSSSSSSPDSRISTRGHLKKSQDSSDIYGSRNHPLDIIAEYIRERNVKPVVNRSAKSASSSTTTTRRQFGADKDEETAAATEATVPGTITDRSIMDTVGNAVNNVVNGIGDTVKGIGSAISGMFNAVKNYAAKLLQYVGKLLLWPFAKVAQWLLSKYELLVWAEVKLFVGVLGVWIAIAVQGLIGVIFKLIYEWLTKHKVD